jgi:glycosyltransferase involved in cell wall biosynthesis
VSALRRALGRAWRDVSRSIGHPSMRGWAPYSRLFLMSDHPSWVLAYEMQEVGKIAARAGIETAPPALWPYARHQSVFYASHLSLLSDEQWRQPNRLGMAYLHGKPGTGFREFDRAFEALCAHHDRFERVQVSHSEMHRVVLQSGIAADRVAIIPLGVDLQIFPRVTPAARAAARARFGIPNHARVVGSFQKDGVGWEAGSEPKMVKGPDTLLAAIDQLRRDVPNLFVLLSGPARGYVMDGLRKQGVPFVHEYLDDARALAPLYHAIDVYLVPSRQEGGPKAVLESMSSGVALVTTRVGQAMDLVDHQRNGWIVDVEDVGALARWTREVLLNGAPSAVLDAARATAEANSYERQQPMWERFFDGFVERTRPA